VKPKEKYDPSEKKRVFEDGPKKGKARILFAQRTRREEGYREEEVISPREKKLSGHLLG